MQEITQVIIWQGWVGGLAIGSYLLFQLILTGHPLGVSTAFGNVCGFFSRLPFFHRGKYEDNFNWRLWFIIGIPLGGVIAALTSPQPMVASFNMGEMYESVLPDPLWLKGLVLTGGGILIGLGSRMAGGCTSGHSISGLAQLNPPSIAASAGFFAGGIIIVQVLFTILPALG